MDEAIKRLKMIEEFYHIFDQWLTLIEDGISVDSILKKRGYNKVAIYGMGTMAMHFIKALENSSVSVEYAIDKSSADFYTNVKVVAEDDVLDQVDVIVYTNPNENIEIVQKIASRQKCDIVSLADVIFDNMK